MKNIHVFKSCPMSMTHKDVLWWVKDTPTGFSTSSWWTLHQQGWVVRVQIWVGCNIVRGVHWMGRRFPNMARGYEVYTSQMEDVYEAYAEMLNEGIDISKFLTEEEYDNGKA